MASATILGVLFSVVSREASIFMSSEASGILLTFLGLWIRSLMNIS